MIISGNRSTRLNGEVVFAVREGYGTEDIGRILYENELNEMNIFNAALKNDFAEINAVQEGTMLESEIRALQEASAAKFVEAVKAKLIAFWEKMKAVFRKAYSNLAVYAVKYGKTFVNKNAEALLKLDDSMKLTGTFHKIEKGYDQPGSRVTHDFQSLMSKEGSTANDFAQLYIKSYFGSNYDSEKGVYGYLADKYMPAIKNPTLGELGGVKNMMNNLRSAQDNIKALKNLEASLEKDIKTSVKQLNSSYKQTAKGADKEVKKEMNADVKHVNMVASGMTNAIAAITQAQIKLAVNAVKSYHGALNAALKLAKVPKEEAKNEAAEICAFALYEAATEVEVGTSDEASENLTPEQEEVVDAIIDAAEALKDEAPEDKPSEEEPAGDEE